MTSQWRLNSCRSVSTVAICLIQYGKQCPQNPKEALGPYRDDRIEYQFAKERIKQLQAATTH